MSPDGLLEDENVLLKDLACMGLCDAVVMVEEGDAVMGIVGVWEDAGEEGEGKEEVKGAAFEETDWVS